MNPGRELDALIAEKVMGFPSPNEPDLSQKDFEDRLNCHYPYYSTDIAAAWEVVEKMRAEHKQFSLECNRGIWTAGFDWFKEGKLESRSAPLAICLAALKACTP